MSKTKKSKKPYFVLVLKKEILLVKQIYDALKKVVLTSKSLLKAAMIKMLRWYRKIKRPVVVFLKKQIIQPVKKASKKIARPFQKFYQKNKSWLRLPNIYLFNPLASLIRFCWKSQFLYSIIILVISYFLYTSILSTAFKEYLNCKYLLPDTLCNGVDFELFEIKGIGDKADSALEIARMGIIKGAFIAVIVVSFFITWTINNIQSVIKFLTFNKTEWKRLFGFVKILVTCIITFTIGIYYLVHYFNVVGA